MEIVLGAVVAAVVSVAVVLLLGRQRGGRVATAQPPPVSGGSAQSVAPPVRSAAGAHARGEDGEVDTAMRTAVREEINAELRERRAEIARIEERLLRKEEALDVRLAEVERRETSLED